MKLTILCWWCENLDLGGGFDQIDKICHQHLKLLTNIFRLQNPSRTSILLRLGFHLAYFGWLWPWTASGYFRIIPTCQTKIRFSITTWDMFTHFHRINCVYHKVWIIRYDSYYHIVWSLRYFPQNLTWIWIRKQSSITTHSAQTVQSQWRKILKLTCLLAVW